jgi:hypothetical protein
LPSAPKTESPPPAAHQLRTAVSPRRGGVPASCRQPCFWRPFCGGTPVEHPLSESRGRCPAPPQLLLFGYRRPSVS